VAVEADRVAEELDRGAGAQRLLDALVDQVVDGLDGSAVRLRVGVVQRERAGGAAVSRAALALDDEQDLDLLRVDRLEGVTDPAGGLLG
jgi:hypothetical protein